MAENYFQSPSNNWLVEVGTPVTTNSAALVATGYTLFSTNNPSVTIFPTVAGTYKVYCIGAAYGSSAGQICGIKINGASGSPTSVFNQEAIWAQGDNGFETLFSTYALFTLSAGVTYTWNLFGKVSGGGIALASGQVAGGVALVAEQLTQG